jgi:death-on-curing protein
VTIVEYLSVDDVIDIAAVATQGQAMVRNRFVLESAVGQPTMTMFGEDLYPDLASKAAVLWYSIDHNQPFLDGNKRTAIESAKVFLAINGWRLDLHGDALYDLAMQVATGAIKDPEGLAEILRRAIVPS